MGYVVRLAAGYGGGLRPRRYAPPPWYFSSEETAQGPALCDGRGEVDQRGAACIEGSQHSGLHVIKGFGRD